MSELFQSLVELQTWTKKDELEKLKAVKRFPSIEEMPEHLRRKYLREVIHLATLCALFDCTLDRVIEVVTEGINVDEYEREQRGEGSKGETASPAPDSKDSLWPEGT